MIHSPSQAAELAGYNLFMPYFIRPSTVVSPLLLLGLIAGCEQPPEPVAAPYRPPDPWPNDQEVLYQTREVINYLDEQRALELGRLDSLGVLPPEAQDQPAQTQADQHQAHNQGVAPAHEGG